MEPSSRYYVTNKSVEPELLFRSEENIDFFLEKLDKHIAPVASICFCSITPTEFQLVIQTKSVEEIREAREQLTTNRKSLNRFIIQRFINLFNSYAQAYNRYYDRRGALFQKNFRYYLTNEKEYELLVSLSETGSPFAA